MHERDLFTTALEIDDESARRAYLDAACADDPVLRMRVERLLNRAGNAGDFLEQPAADLCSDIDAEWLAEAHEPQQASSDPPTMIGKADETGQTILLNQSRSAAAESNSKVMAPSQSATTSASSVFGTLFGRYQVERVLGSGGMGVVYLAEDLRLGRRVALKIPKFDADDKFHLSERFRREARTMASVLHRNLCPIFDVDEQDGTHYLTMAFIDGETLSQIIKRGHERTAGTDSNDRRVSGQALAAGDCGALGDSKPAASAVPLKGGMFTARQIAELIRKLALALDEAHRAGVVHRDLKPANVMIDRSGEPILMDFGLAWLAHEADARVTQSGAIVGTPAYMSPEQAEGHAEKVGPLSDIYSLGAILFELLAGRQIYTGGMTRVLYQLTHVAPTRPSELRSDVDPQLEAICWKAIARRPEDRFASAAEFAEALASFLDDRPSGISDRLSVVPNLGSSSSRVVISDRTEVLPPDTGTDTIAYVKPPAVQRGKSRIVLASVLLIGLLGVVWAIVAGRAKPPREDIVQGTKLPVSPDREPHGKNAAPDKTADAPPVKPDAEPIRQTGFALEFDGRSSHVAIPTLKRDEPGPVTLEAWVEAEKQTSSKMIFAFGGKQFCGLSVSDQNWFANDPTLQGFPENPWTPGLRHLAFVIDDREGRLFLDGKLVSSRPQTKGPEVVEDLHAWLGAGLFGGRLNYFYRGTVRELRVSQVARYDQDFVPVKRFAADQDTLALYHFDEGSGDVLKDSSGHGHHGQIVGAKWVQVQEGVNPDSPSPAKAPFAAAQARAYQQAWAKHLGVPAEYTNSVGMTFVLIPPGEFQMGSTDEQVAAAAKIADDVHAEPTTKDRIQKVERPQHRVVITNPYLLGATEVTIAQFKKFSATGFRTEAEKLAKDATSETYLTPGYPVTNDSPAAVITWNDAVAYCRWLSDVEQATYRLPTEAEWEYACRAGTTTQYSFGDDYQELANFGWFKENSDNRSHEVGQKRPNAFGLHDMHGNLWEWCQDFYDESWYAKSPTDNPTGPALGSQHVIRGGYWPSSASTNRSTHRGRTIPSNRSNHFGFRVVRELHAFRPLQAARLAPLKLELGGQLPSVTNATGLKLGDLDGDGDLDLFVAMLKAPCLVFRNDGKGGFTESGQQLGDNASFAVALGDLDGDGDLDAFVCNSDEQVDAIWLNDGRGMFQRSPQSFPPSSSNDVALADVDGDKDLDVVVSNWKGSVEIWINDGAGLFVNRQSISRISNTGVALGDLDGDGDADLVMTCIGGDNRVWLNDGQGHFTDSEQSLELDESTSVALGDLDRDGDLDLFLTGNHGNRVWFNDGHGRYRAGEQRLGSGKCEAVELVDLDADHDLDAVTIAGGWSDSQTRFVWLNDGQGRFQKGPALAAGNTQSLTSGDLDGDGDADVVFGNLNQPAEVWVNQSNQSTIP